MGIERSVEGTLRVAAEDYRLRNNYHTYYRKLTLEQIQEWVLQALVNGAKPAAEVDVYHSTMGADSLTVKIPANFEAIPDVPTAGHNAAFNRKMAFIAAVAVMAAVAVFLALVTVLVVR